jgi:hypothetical protein
MLTMTLMLAICSIIIELIVTRTVRIIETFARKNLLTSIVVSLAVSWTIGTVFGAKGLTVLTAAMIATAVTSLWYRTLNLTRATKEKIHASRHQRERT